MAPPKPASKPMSKRKKKSSSKRMNSLLSTRNPNKMGNKPDPLNNPFETIWSRRKFDVLGKKRKGEERRVGLSRSLAIEKRKKTLLKEYEQSSKSSVFNDKRIGENDDSLQDYEKAILRQQKERMSKLKRKSKFNLSDDEEETEKDDFEEVLPPDEDENVDFINLDTENLSHSMNGKLPEGTEQPYKTKKQVMSEIIEKSKFFKAEKAKEKEEDEELMQKLDQDFNSLAQTEALNALLTKNAVPARTEKSTGSKPDFSLTKEKPDAYDKLVKEMVMESRARPSDRQKTPEEIAREERERLEQLEEERQKRMLAPDEDDDSSEEENDDNNKNNKKMSKNLQLQSGDDIGDSFLLDTDPTNKTTKNDDSSQSESDQESESESESEELNSVKDWEQSDDDELALDPDKIKELNNDKNLKKKEGKIKNQETESKLGLPFVIEAPNNLKELCEILDGRSESEIVEAINRIRACSSVRLGTDNRKKMQVFYGLLLQYFATVANRSPLNMKKLDSLVKPLIEMSSETPYFAAICARERLVRIRAKFCQDIKIEGKDSWPSVKTLILFRLWSLKFPSSDFRHVVVTPLLLLIGEFLMRCRVESVRDLGVGAFLCSLLLSSVKQSKKYCSEAIIFIQTLLLSSINLHKESEIPSQLSQLAELREIKPYLCINNKECEINRINFISFFETQPDSPYFSSDQFKASVLLSASEALMGFIQVYEELNSFPEIFGSISVLLRIILEKNEIPSLLRGNLQNCLDFIERKIMEHNNTRLPLQMNKKKIEPIRLMNPQFEENFVKGVDYDPDRERVKHKRLLKRIKSEEKGSRRELRKDKDFLVQVRERKRREEETERAEKYGKNLAFLQDQERAFKSGQLGKGRKRRK